MKPTFEPFCQQQLFPHEGGYVDHPRDPGGATNFGITLATLREWRGKPVTKADVRFMSKDEAKDIYKARYWNKINADMLPAGPDAALFDVSVNSGVGRAKQWLPLISGKGPVDAVKAVCARRRAFFRSLSTFDVFGKGWMRRVNSVEAWCIAWAVKTAGGDVRGTLQHEAEVSDRTTKQAGAAAGTGTAGAGAAAPQAASVDWTTLILVGVPVAIAVAWLIYIAVSNSSRAAAMKEAQNV